MRIGPQSLLPRFALIITMPILVLIILSTYIFYQRHWENISTKMRDTLANEAVVAYYTYKMGDNKYYRILGFNASELNSRGKFTNTDIRLLDISKRINAMISIEPIIIFARDEQEIWFFFVESSKVIKLAASIKKIESPTTYIFILWLSGLAGLLMFISLIFMRNQVKVIIELANLAEKFGMGQNVGYIKKKGALEIKKLIGAFIKMKGRIERQILYRNQLLAHISHDLRTPLTRIRLAVELTDDKGLIKDVGIELIELEEMIDGYINFAKEEGNEESQQFDFNALLLDLKQRYPEMDFKMPEGSCVVLMRYKAIKRALVNVIENAIKYRKKYSKLKVVYRPNLINVYIDDDGQGIAKKHYRRVFEPFNKLDEKSKGYGLGLAIVKTIIYAHGGKITLDKSNLGGLKMNIKIPY
jgi:two-component system osmolarity sensor histidine kinase EnvZ